MSKQINKICQVCGSAFKGRRDAKTCSPACRKRLERQRSLKNRLLEEAKKVEQAAETDIELLAASLLPHQLEQALVTDRAEPELPPESGSIPVPTPINIDDQSTDKRIAVRSGLGAAPALIPSAGMVSMQSSDETTPDTAPQHLLNRFAMALTMLILLLFGGVVFNLFIGHSNHTRISQLNIYQRQQFQLQLKRQQSITDHTSHLEVKVNALAAKIANLPVASAPGPTTVKYTALSQNSSSSSGSTNIDASQITSGTLNNARLSGDVALLDGINHFQPTTDNAVAFSIQNAGGTLTLINIDTTGGGLISFGTPVNFGSTATFGALGAAGNTAVCLNGSNQLANCAGGGTGVTSLNGLSGALSIANATGSGSSVTINNASTSQKGIAQFDNTDFTVTNGNVSTIQPIGTAATPTFGGLTLSNLNTVGIVTNTAGGILGTTQTLPSVVQGNITGVGALGSGSIGGSFGNISIGGTIQGTVINATTGFQVAGAATSGNYLRGNGTDFVSSAIQAGDIGGTFFTLQGSTGTPQNVTAGSTVSLLAGSSGNLTSVASATNTVTVDIVNNPTFSGQVTASNTGAVALAVTGAPTVSATSSLIQIGSAIASGNNSTNGGTYISVNSPASGAGSAADLINLEANGNSRFKVDTFGNAYANGNFQITTSSLTAGALTKVFTIGTGGVSANDVVVLANDGGNIRAIDTSTARDPRVLGIANAAGVSGNTISIRLVGNGQVNVDSGAVALGDQLVTSSTSGDATVDNSATAGIIGIATSTKTAGSPGTVSITIRPVGGVTNPTFGGNVTVQGTGSFTGAGTGLSVTNNATVGGTLTVSTLGTGSGTSYLCSNSGVIASCAGTGSGAAFVQGGNSFAAQAVLGTKDNNSLALETNNGTKVVLDTSGNLQFQQASTISTSSGNLTLQANGTSTLALDTTGAGTVSLGATSATTVSVGTGSTARAVAVGNTQSGTTVTSTAGGIVATISNAGDVIQSTTNSTTAFQVQNAAGTQLLNFNTSTTPNLISNGGFEVNTTGWAAKGSATLSRDTTNQYEGSASLLITTTANIGDGASFNVTLSPNTTYVLEMMYKSSTTTANSLSIGRQDVSGTDPSGNCTTNQFTLWIYTSCSFTTGSTITNSNIFVKQTDATARSIWLDAVQLQTTNQTTPYQNGLIQLNGVVSSPFIEKTSQGSTRAFTIFNPAGSTEELTVDNVNNRVGINLGGVSNPQNTLSVTGLTTQESTAQLAIGTGSATNQGLLVQGKSGQTANLVEIQNSSGTILSKFDANGILGGANGSGTDAAGSALTLAGGQSTGLGNGGNINFQIAPPGVGSGTATNALTTVASLNGGTGGASFQNAVNSGTAFQIQNAAGSDNNDTLLGISSVYPASNLVTNGSFEQDTNGWAAKGNMTISQVSGLSPPFGSQALQITNNGTPAAQDGAKYLINLSSATNYALSFYAKIPSGTFTNMSFGRSDSGAGQTTCNTTSAPSTTAWNRFTCTFTTGTTTPGSSFIYIGQNDTTARTWYIDGVSLQQVNSAAYYSEGSLNWNGLALGNTLIQPATASNQAFTVATPSGAIGINLDTVNANLNTSFAIISSGRELLSNTNTAALSVRNATSLAPLFNLNTNILNLDTNGSFENSATAASNYSVNHAGITQTVDTTAGNAYIGSNTDLIATTSSAVANTGIKYNLTTVTLASGTAYTLSFFAKLQSGQGAFTTLDAGRADNGAAETTCTLNSTTVTTYWQRYTCSFTTGTTSGTPYFFIGQTDAGTGHSYYLDGVQIESGGLPDNYREGSIQLNGDITSPTVFRPQSDSTSAFQIQDTGSTTTLLNADTANTKLSVTGQLAVTGGLSTVGLSVPPAPGVGVIGTGGSTSYSYEITALNANGGETLPSAAGTSTTSNATLTGSNFNQLLWTTVPGASSYNIYRTASGGTPSSTGLIGNVLATSSGSSVLTFNDTGIAATTAVPTIDNSGQFKATGTVLFQNAANSAAAFQVQNAGGTAAVIVSTNNVTAGANAANATLDVAKDSGTSRSINAAGTINASGTDYAEYIPWDGPHPDQGSIVSYEGSDYVVSAPTQAGFVGGGSLDEANALLVAFTGQVAVKVTGNVNIGDLLVDNGDGTAKAVNPAQATVADYLAKIGIAQAASTDPSVKLIQAAIGTTSANTLNLQEQGSNFSELNITGTATVNQLIVSGTATIANLTVTGSAQFKSDIIVGGHIITAGGQPTATAQTGSGAGATVTVSGTDTTGTITITTGSNPSSGTLADILFSKVYGAVPRILISGQDGKSAASFMYPSDKTVNGFELRMDNPPQADTTYTFDYFIAQ